MIILLRNEMEDNHEDTQARLIQASHVEFFVDRVEFYNEVVEHSSISVRGGDYLYGESYDFCIVYDNDMADALLDEFPNAFVDVELGEAA